MVSKVSFQSANTQKNLWSAFQNNHGQTSKTVPNNPASAIQKNANDKVSRTVAAVAREEMEEVD